MKKLLLFTHLLFLAFVVCQLSAQNYHVRIGTIGNSITQGVGLPNPAAEAYPIQLRPLLEAVYGDTVIVQNFGITTTTMLKNGDVSYWDSKEFVDYMAYAPEICIILLGTNDTKPQNWDVYGNEYIDDYLAMIDTIKSRNPTTRFMVGYPPPAYQEMWGIRDSIVVHGIIPGVDSVLAKTDAELVDFYHPLVDSVHLFPDYIHPNVEGSRVMAEILAEAIINSDIIHKADTGNTFITSFKTNSTALAVGDSAELSWTTINADTLMLNDVQVETSQSIKVSPLETTTYTLIAKGGKSNDTVSLTQVVYTPELARLRITPTSMSMFPEETRDFSVFYQDQHNRIMEDTVFNVTWTITEGSGTLSDITETTVTYHSVEPGMVTLTVSYEDLSAEASINVKGNPAELDYIAPKKDVYIFPNPADEAINFLFTRKPEGECLIRIFDMRGQLIHDESLTTTHKNYMRILDTSDFPQGNYIINLEIGQKIISDKLIIHRD